MTSYEERRVKLINTQLNKLKFSAKNKAWATLRITNKKFQNDELPRELILTTRGKTKIKNAFANTMLALSQLAKINQSRESFGFWLSNLGKKAVTNVAIPFTTVNLP